MEKCNLVFFVNGKKVTVISPDPETTLLRFLREELGLRGTKLGCAEGGCGACTVMISKATDRKLKKVSHYSVNACLYPLCALHGLAVTTVEGIGSIREGLHPVQERLFKAHGSQCGFCTPGFVMSMYTLLRNSPCPSTSQLLSAFEGNLCRCTGYRPILDGYRTFTEEFICPMGANCCQKSTQDGTKECDTGEQSSGDQSTNHKSTVDIVPVTLNEADSCFKPYDPSQEPIFPPELMISDHFDIEETNFTGESVTWCRPVTLDRLLQLKAEHPSAKLVLGNTEIGVETKFKGQLYPMLLAPTHISELLQVSIDEKEVTFGASVSLKVLRETVSELVNKEPGWRTQTFGAIQEMLQWFAGQQIKNVASIGGNIMTASPISDLNPLWMAAGCTLTFVSKDRGQRSVPMDHRFFLGYRRLAVEKDEILLNISVPFTKENEYFYGYKQAHRKDDDIAIVNAGMRVAFSDSSPTSKVTEASLAFGGMAPVTVLAVKTAEKTLGRKWDKHLLRDVTDGLSEELALKPDVPGGMAAYRNTLTLSFFFKFYLYVLMQMEEKQDNGGATPGIPRAYTSALRELELGVPESSQAYEEETDGQGHGTGEGRLQPLGRPLPHSSAEKQVTGEAVYVDDKPHLEGELQMGFVLSTVAHATILSVDHSVALSMPGVVDYVDHRDIPGTNVIGNGQDEEFFASKKVHCQGQVIGCVLADTKEHAQKAARKVKVQYEPHPAIITIEEAIEAESFFGSVVHLSGGQVTEDMESAECTLEGTVRTGAQEHFYLETNACLVVPMETGEFEVLSSTQNPTKCQTEVANALALPCNRVVCRTKRLGGAFGGKEFRAEMISTAAAVASNKVGKPVRCMLDRDEDMVMMGTRHPFLANYKVGYNRDGKLVALEIRFFSNCGFSLDLSQSVMGKAAENATGSYFIRSADVTGRLCRTNLPSNTAFRGFGAPQAMFVMETIVERVAQKVGRPSHEVQEMNLVQEGDRVYFGEVLENVNLGRCWKQCMEKGEFISRKKRVEVFNSEHRWKKRGLSIIPTMFGICFEQSFLNQSGALVHIYKDGSVLVSHGGTEMGQGLHIKMIQVASATLQIPAERVFISETSTSSVPNTVPTAASSGSDLNGMAVQFACEELLGRLRPYQLENPQGTWGTWVMAAYMNSVSLSSTGFYTTPNVGKFFSKGEGKVFAYYTYGTASSEVEIDCLTGDHKVLRTDIVMDVGRSLNPAIDIGQIEGAFAQGYGLFMLEQLKVRPDGSRFTRGPGAYKIPSVGNTPSKFHISLLKGVSNPKAVYSSKGIGEPPLFLSASVFFAAKEAIASAREDQGVDVDFRLDAPATPERIRMACADSFTEKFPEAEPGTYQPFYVEL